MSPYGRHHAGALGCKSCFARDTPRRTGGRGRSRLRGTTLCYFMKAKGTQVTLKTYLKYFKVMFRQGWNYFEHLWPLFEWAVGPLGPFRSSQSLREVFCARRGAHRVQLAADALCKKTLARSRIPCLFSKTYNINIYIILYYMILVYV